MYGGHLGDVNKKKKNQNKTKQATTTHKQTKNKTNKQAKKKIKLELCGLRLSQTLGRKASVVIPLPFALFDNGSGLGGL